MIDLMDAFPAHARETVYEGFVKFKLVHAPGRSVFMPDLVVLDLVGWKWFQPLFFGAPQLSFYGDLAYAQFDIDVESGPRLLLGFTRETYVRGFADGSHMYRCKIAGPQ